MYICVFKVNTDNPIYLFILYNKPFITDLCLHNLHLVVKVQNPWYSMFDLQFSYWHTNEELVQEIIIGGSHKAKSAGKTNYIFMRNSII